MPVLYKEKSIGTVRVFFEFPRRGERPACNLKDFTLYEHQAGTDIVIEAVNVLFLQSIFGGQL